MHIIQNNPYRTIGLLVGATAKEHDRQVKRLKQLIEAEQEPPDYFSFPTLGDVNRTLEKVNEASSKLNLNDDKMSFALFWFYNGNPITDEPAFDAIKEADFDQVISIWTKLTSNGEVSQRNASAYSNLGTLYLSGILEGTNTNEALLEQGVSLKLKFLESDLVKDFKELATDETYNTTKKELQLLFLNQLQSEIEKSGGFTSNKLLAILTKQEFSAKEDFLKGFVEKQIEVIENKLEEAKLKRKANKANSVNIGKALYEQIAERLDQIKSILGESNIKYASIADKVANEILQCTIDYFNYYQEIKSNIDYTESAWILAKSTKKIAIGEITKDRIVECLNTLEEIKNKSILTALKFLQSIKNAYENNINDIEQQAIYKVSIEYDSKRKPKLKTTKDSKAIEDIINNSIDWKRVNEILAAYLTDTNLKKIKESDNDELKKDFLELANWLKTHSLESTTILNIIMKYRKIPTQLPFKIIESSVKNTNNEPLFTKFIRFISVDLKIQVIEEKEVTLFIRYINPDGTIKCNLNTSPPGYTFSETKSINLNTTLINLSGWGNSDKCIYDVGKNLIEIYYNDTLIHTLNFIVDITPSEKLEIELKKAREIKEYELKMAHEKLEIELKKAHEKLKEIKSTKYFLSELSSAENELAKIKEWSFLRSNIVKTFQIEQQQEKIKRLTTKANDEKNVQIDKQLIRINEIEDEIQKLKIKVK